MLKKIFIIIYLFPFFAFYFFAPVMAQTTVTPTDVPQNATDSNISLGIATNIPLNETAEDGDIISYTPDGFKVSTSEYDTNIVGIISLNPAISLDYNVENTTNKNIYPMIKTGSALVKVSLVNGNIKKGDSIATSSMRGVGMKAINSGFVIGSALEDYSTSNPQASDQKLIMVALNIHFFSTNTNKNSSIFDLFSLSVTTASQEPFRVFKYVLSALVVIISVVIAFVSFGRLARSGVEALGRNPLASRSIHIGIIFNTLICLAIIGTALFIATLIIRI